MRIVFVSTCMHVHTQTHTDALPYLCWEVCEEVTLVLAQQPEEGVGVVVLQHTGVIVDQGPLRARVDLEAVGVTGVVQVMAQGGDQQRKYILHSYACMYT